jgi:Mg2+ and Co2+ transporter CorA
MDGLQKSMQALTLCRDTMKNLIKITDSPDEQSHNYLTKLYQSIDMIIDKLKNNDTVSARIHTIELSQ